MLRSVCNSLFFPILLLDDFFVFESIAKTNTCWQQLFFFLPSHTVVEPVVVIHSVLAVKTCIFMHEKLEVVKNDITYCHRKWGEIYVSERLLCV